MVMASTRAIPKEWMEENRDLKEVIPKAIISFNETLDAKDKVEVLTFLCNVVVPNLSLLDLEEILLCNVFPELAEFVDKLFLEIEQTIHSENVNSTMTKNLPNKSDALHDLLLVLLNILEGIEICVKYIYETFSCINICQVHSLPVPVLLIVKSTFHHCKKSEDAYGDSFHDVSQQLSLIFRKSFELQKVLMELINVKIETLDGNNSEKDLKNIADENIDSNITPGIWKSLMRLVTKNKDRIKHYIQIERIIALMCCTLKTKLQRFEDLSKNKGKTESEPLFSKLLKVLKFLIKLLMTFVQSFQDCMLFSSCKSIVHLLFLVISLTSGPSDSSVVPSAPHMMGQDSRSSLSVVIEPFLQIMVLNKNFADLMTRTNQDVDPKNVFSRCYTLANIMVLLPVISEEMLSYWIDPTNHPEEEPRVSAFEALLQSCNFCHLEMSLPVMLPGAMCNGKPQRMVSLYEYVVSRLAASITAVPSEYFHVVERVLLNNVLGRNLTSSLMATDVWCFMARWATADLCYCHVKIFVEWLKNLSWKSDLQKSRMKTLVRRLLPLLATEHQESLVENYSPGSFDNIEIWSLVPLHKMIEPVRQQVSNSVLQLLKTTLNQWLNQTLSNPELDKSLHCLQNFVSNRSSFDRLSNEQKAGLVALIIRLFDAFLVRPKQIPDSSWSSFIDILSCILPQMTPKDFIKVLSNIAKTTAMFKDHLLGIKIARAVAQCGQRTFAIGQDESRFISEIFRSLVTSSSWLVHTEAFLSLRQFAEVTPHTPILENCVPEELKADFQKFICAIPYGCSEDHDKKEILLNGLKEQTTKPQSVKGKEKDAMVITSQRDSTTAVHSNDVEKRKRDDTDESEAKRKRIENKGHLTSEDEQKLGSSLEQLSRHIQIIQEVTSRCTLFPQDIREKLKTVKESLDTLVKPT